MRLHNYRSRQVHETLNGVNPSSSFRDMRSAKSGPNLWQIWQVFGPWASPYAANEQMSMTVHNNDHDSAQQFHRTSNGENLSSGYRDMGSANLAAAHVTARPPANPDCDDNTLPARRAERLKIAKNSNFEILQETLHVTHLLKLLDKIWNGSIQNCRHYRGDKGCGTDGRMEWKQYTPPTTSLCGVRGGVKTITSTLCILVYFNIQRPKIIAPNKLCLIEGSWFWHPFINLLKINCCVRRVWWIILPLGLQGRSDVAMT